MPASRTSRSRSSGRSERAVPLRERVDVRRHPTVVRLEHLDEPDHQWITGSYHITHEIENHLAAMRQALARPTGCGMFLIGQYGSGKSHFLAYLLERFRAGGLLDEGPRAVAVSLLNFRADVSLESIVREALDLRGEEADRRIEWSSLAERHPTGLVLLIDELSEFLRSKPDEHAYNEDVRFLQFLGEWAQGAPFWILCAMQEEIEHTGALEHGIYRKIKDRFPLRFLLTPAHLRDLIAESILVKRSGYEEATARLIGELRQAFPNSSVDYQQLAAIYPLHPVTLELLEEVRDRFSQARGIVDFTVTQLGGDPTRNIRPFLDRPWGSLLTPDVIVDHFRDLFELQSEFQPIAQQLLPYYRKEIERLFATPALGELAWRILKLLILAHLSPSRNGLAADEIVDWLQHRVTRLDPDKNVQVVRRICQQLVDQGRYVVLTEGRYGLKLDDDGSGALDRFLEARRAELRGGGIRLLESLAGTLPDDAFHPFGLPRDQWQRRVLRWHFHDRPYALYLGDGQPPPFDGTALCVRLPWGDPAPALGHFTLVPQPVPCSDEHIELAALADARQRTWTPEVTRKLETRWQERRRLFAAAIREAYLEGTIFTPSGKQEPISRPPEKGDFFAWIERIVRVVLKRTYPSFELFAPTHGPLPKEAYRALMRFAIDQDLGSASTDEYVQLIREAYLIPMKLLKRQGRGYLFAKHPDRNELVRALLGLVDCQPSPEVVYTHLAQPVYGLVPDQVSLLLIALLLLGEIDIVKQGKSYRDLYETLPMPIQYDRIVPGRALNVEQLRTLSEVCEALGVPVPPQWTVMAQRRAARALRAMAQQRRRPLEALLIKLRQLGQAESLCGKLESMLSQWDTLEKEPEELRALQQFLYSIDSPRRFAATAAELETLPAKIDRLLSEVERIRHLLGHPMVAGDQVSGIASRIDDLGSAPGFDQVEAVEKWLDAARRLYAEYRKEYETRHDAWWRQCEAHPLWSWKPPHLAHSRHVGLENERRELDACREQAARMRCRGRVNFDFQPVCNCQFDGASSPIREAFERFGKLRETIEESVTLFFAQRAVRERIRKWVEDGFEATEQTGEYLEGRAPLPDISDLQQLDDYLSGIELVKDVDFSELLELLERRPWERQELLKEIDALLARQGAARLRFAHTISDAEGALARWCLEQALRSGRPLPRALPALALDDAADAIRVDWVGAAAIDRLEQLGIGRAAEDRILQWLADGQLSPGRPPAASPVAAAAAELHRPTVVATARQLADLSRQLYRAHCRMLTVAGGDWLTRLDQLAQTELEEAPGDLETVLANHRDRGWLILDCLGLPLLTMLLGQLETLFPDWRLEEAVLYARVSETTTTDAFYRQLIDAHLDQPLEKINAVDRILHERFLPLDEFERLAAAELGIALREVRGRLDRTTPLLVFADHGFRIAPDGRAYIHGGASTLERTVPVLRLAPF